MIRKGTAIRRTNETDMNAQSSRSHAIFSLTLTQKKFTGATPPPRSSSPLPPGRSPSRLARPGSMYAGPNSSNRVTSPAFGRPSTPSLTTAVSRGGGLRPASALGHAGERSMHSDEDAGEWVTITSKFHFVDLAGSERVGDLSILYSLRVIDFPPSSSAQLLWENELKKAFPSTVVFLPSATSYRPLGILLVPNQIPPPIYHIETPNSLVYSKIPLVEMRIPS